ncbi:MAG: hypothetical protein GX818_02695, partial [Tissierellia bacterium]|nr:hypothetical protein [Tissierellia bacterium]
IVRDKKVDVDIYEDITFIPNLINSTEELAYLAKKAVIEATKTPFITSKIKAD